ncbi:MAG: HAD hydrolase family protein, partial [Erysipelotrichaceae bacterium]|nr:HAD hydrolase family protein [Erysipelotrichaceae bacterium]
REHLDLSEFAAIGDEENDISMLKIVGRPFVMAHAKESVKKYGQIVSSEAEMIEILLQESEND